MTPPTQLTNLTQVARGQKMRDRVLPSYPNHKCVTVDDSCMLSMTRVDDETLTL